MAEEGPTIFVVDDDPSIRKSLSLLLKSVGYVVKPYSSAKEFLASERDCRGPTCLVLDVQMPGLSGIDLQEELASWYYSMPIIFISAHADVPMGVNAMKKGAVEFLTKPFEESDLLNAVHEALRKDTQTRAVLDEQKRIRQRLASLTPREYETLTYLITGMLNKQIAYALNIAERTVKAHRSRVMEKMGVDSVAELVRLAEKVDVKPAESGTE